MYDENGKVVMSLPISHLNGRELVIEANQLPKGIYFIELTGNKTFKTTISKI
jgi:hypothetical protein